MSFSAAGELNLAKLEQLGIHHAISEPDFTVALPIVLLGLYLVVSGAYPGKAKRNGKTDPKSPSLSTKAKKRTVKGSVTNMTCCVVSAKASRYAASRDGSGR